MAVAFLFNEEQEVLFLQKKQKDTFLAGFLVPIGGHIEGEEMNEPQKACLREIEEEPGITSEYIENLELKYMVYRMMLKWIGYNDIPKQNVSVTTIEIVKHYKEIGKSNERVYVGSMKSLGSGIAPSDAFPNTARSITP